MTQHQWQHSHCVL